MKKVVLILLTFLLVAGTIWKWDIVVSKWNTFAQTPKDKEEIKNISQPKAALAKRGAIRVFVEVKSGLSEGEEILLPDEGEEESRWRKNNGTQRNSARDGRRKVRMIGRALR